MTILLFIFTNQVVLTWLKTGKNSYILTRSFHSNNVPIDDTNEATSIGIQGIKIVETEFLALKVNKTIPQ